MASASRCGPGRRSRRSSIDPHNWCKPANANSISDCTPEARASPHPSARSRRYTSSADLPTPASPSITSAALSPRRTALSSRSSVTRSCCRPCNMAGGYSRPDRESRRRPPPRRSLRRANGRRRPIATYRCRRTSRLQRAVAGEAVLLDASGTLGGAVAAPTRSPPASIGSINAENAWLSLGRITLQRPMGEARRCRPA